MLLHALFHLLNIRIETKDLKCVGGAGSLTIPPRADSFCELGRGSPVAARGSGFCFSGE